MASGDGVLRFDAEFNKVSGTLSLTRTHIAWVPNTPNAMDRQNQALNRVTRESALGRYSSDTLEASLIHLIQG